MPIVIPDEVVQIMRDLEGKHHLLFEGMDATLVLNPSGSGAFVFEDRLRNRVIAVVDFDEDDDIVAAARHWAEKVAAYDKEHQHGS